MNKYRVKVERTTRSSNGQAILEDGHMTMAEIQEWINGAGVVCVQAPGTDSWVATQGVGGEWVVVCPDGTRYRCNKGFQALQTIQYEVRRISRRGGK